MKKQLLTGAFILASFFTAQAQTQIYVQQFEGTPAEIGADGWGAFDFDGDGASIYTYSANNFLAGLGFSGKVAGSENFIINEAGTEFQPLDDADNAFASPAVPLASEGSYYATFRVGGSSITEAPATVNYSVYAVTLAEVEAVGEASADAAAFTAGIKALIDAKTPVSTGGLVEESKSVSVDLTSFAGSSVSLIFRHHNSAENYGYFFMDDVTFFSGVLATDKFVSSSLSVFPNPTNGVVNITNIENILVNDVTVSDLNGRTVKTVKFAGVAEAQVNLSDLSSGVYMMTISSDKGSVTKKIVKN